MFVFGAETQENLFLFTVTLQHLKYVEMLLYTIDFSVTGDGLGFDSSSGYSIENIISILLLGRISII